MQRSGQISYFIIVAVSLFLVMVVLLYMFASDKKIEIRTEGSPIPAMPAIQNFVQACIELVGTKGIYHLAYNGGYVSPKGDLTYGEPGDGRRTFHYTRDTVLPYAVRGKETFLRPLLDIEAQLSRYMMVKLDECLDFTNFEAQGLIVKKPELDFSITGFDPANTKVSYATESVGSIVSINENDVNIEVTYPILVQSNRGQALITKEFATLDFRLGKLHGITGALIADSMKYESYDLTQHCKKFGAQDGLVNVYLDYNELYQDHGLFVVDAQPLKRGFTPLRFQVGVLNQKITGECTG